MMRRRTNSSIAPSPTSSSRSGSGGLQAAQLPKWKFAQVLGDNGVLQDDDADEEISALEFDGRGEHLAAGDHAGRVILFRRTDADDTRSRAQLERADHAGAPPPRYTFATEFQSHELEFDALHSLEICEKVKKLRWCAQPNSSLFMLAANDRTVKLWKVSKHTPKKGNDGQKRRATPALFADPVGYRSGKDQGGDGAGDDGYSAKCRRVFGRAHQYNIHSISTNCDGETFVSADDLRINLWHLEVTSRCFNIVDKKPADMEDLVEVITAAEFHPSSCSSLAYGSSSGVVRLVDLRRSALCDQSARTFQDRANRLHPKTFFTEIIACITDLKFTGDGKHLLTRDFMNLKLWDLRKESSPVVTYKVHEFLRPKLPELYTDDRIFDRFSCCASNDGSYFATGSYGNTFKVFSLEAGNTSGTTLEASRNPYRTQTYRRSKGPVLLNNFACGSNKKGRGGLRPAGNEEISCDTASSVTHMEWHPTENFIVCAANNSLYMYHT